MPDNTGRRASRGNLMAVLRKILARLESIDEKLGKSPDVIEKSNKIRYNNNPLNKGN